jgi:hypothetical protein
MIVPLIRSTLSRFFASLICTNLGFFSGMDISGIVIYLVYGYIWYSDPARPFHFVHFSTSPHSSNHSSVGFILISVSRESCQCYRSQDSGVAGHVIRLKLNEEVMVTLALDLPVDLT